MEKEKALKTISKLEDKYFGIPGSLERQQYEFELNMEIIGENLKKLRKNKRLTQEQLGNFVGVQKAQISKLENGANSATINTIVKVFHALKARVIIRIEPEDIGKNNLIENIAGK